MPARIEDPCTKHLPASEMCTVEREWLSYQRRVVTRDPTDDEIKRVLSYRKSLSLAKRVMSTCDLATHYPLLWAEVQKREHEMILQERRQKQRAKAREWIRNRRQLAANRNRRQLAANPAQVQLALADVQLALADGVADDKDEEMEPVDAAAHPASPQ